MGDIQNRPFSKNYSGLINQTVIGVGIAVLCISGHELMKRKRRGKAQLEPPPGLGSRESWEFGYLYQGRSWARHPSPPSPAGWPLSWIKQAIKFPEERLLELRGLDATLYIRFLRGCFWFSLVHLLTTFPILFPIHVSFSEESVSPKSMTRASISSLVGTEKGLSLLWIHICLLFWLTLSWMGTLFWICNGAFKLRALSLDQAARHEATLAEHPDLDEDATTYYEHPHPMYSFRDVPSRTRDKPVKGLRLRTIMVSNVPSSLRNEKDLQEYFEYYMSRKLEKPSLAISGSQSTQPGFLNKSFAFLFNRAKHLPAHLPIKPLSSSKDEGSEDGHSKESKRKSTSKKKVGDAPLIERVVIARKMTELASLLERREDILVQLETAHIKLANKALLAVKAAMERQDAKKPIGQSASKAAEVAKQRRSLKATNVDAERGEPQEEGTLDEEERMEQLIQVLGPFVEEFGTQRPLTTRSKKAISRTSRLAFQKIRPNPSAEESDSSESPVAAYPPASSSSHSSHTRRKTVWDALLSLPRTSLDAYQPLVNLSHLFRGKVVPSIDYYTAKINLLTSLITENRSKHVTDYDPVSTAFVTFADPADARRACKYLAVHPNNPMACLVTMAPAYQDIDWIRVMKSTYKGEFIKDWVVNVGVWAFTLFWLFPVSLLVGLVSIQNISLFWPSLKTYLDHHQWQSEVLQSFIPTLLVALLALLIPLILLLIAKKAHTITTLSALHDRIMTRYYKFLIVNVLVFFCVGTAALQSFLNAFRSASHVDVISVVATSFPTAGPFYVGWLIFTTAMHGGFELAMIGLPLILYPRTSRQVTPRKRAVGTRPRTFNFYYWLPNHTLVIHVLLLFSVLNPFVLPFGTLYFFVQSGVVKNQLLHVYAKNYEEDGRVLMIRIVRYSLDGLVLSQAVFLAYMVVLKKSANVGLAAFLIVFTVIVKLLMTRMCRAQYEVDDIHESDIMCRGPQHRPASPVDGEEEELIRSHQDSLTSGNVRRRLGRMSVVTWKLPAWVNFSYSTMNQRAGPRHARPPNPFGPHVDKNASEEGYVDVKKDMEVMSGETEEKPADFAAPSSPPRAAEEGYPWHLRQSHSSPHRHDPGVLNLDARSVDASGPVVPHAPPIPWDDQTTLDLPYDNPFYTRIIDNVLWLPRDPTGILDLDDTVDLRIAIPVDSTAGRLGTWTGLNEAASPDEMSNISPGEAEADRGDASSQHLSVPRLTSTSMQATPSEVSGTEDIELPSVIARRVQAKESDVERPVRSKKSGLFPRRPSGSSLRAPTMLSVSVQGTPSIHNEPRPTLLSARTFSEGSGPHSRRSRARSGTMSSLQVPSPSAIERARSDTEFGIRLVDAHAQADFVAANSSSSRISLPLSPGQHHQHPHQQHYQQGLALPLQPQQTSVSAATAIFHEVLEEERQALRDRIEEETAEATKGQSTKSWLTSWMFRKPDSATTPGGS